MSLIMHNAGYYTHEGRKVVVRRYPSEGMDSLLLLKQVMPEECPLVENRGDFFRRYGPFLFHMESHGCDGEYWKVAVPCKGLFVPDEPPIEQLVGLSLPAGSRIARIEQRGDGCYLGRILAGDPRVDDFMDFYRHIIGKDVSEFETYVPFEKIIFMRLERADGPENMPNRN